MSSGFSFAYNSSMNRNQVLHVWQPRLEYGLAWARAHLIVLAVIYALIDIGQVTRTNSLGVRLNQYITQRDKVYLEVQGLTISVAQARSLQLLSSKSQGMTEPQSVLFAGSQNLKNQ